MIIDGKQVAQEVLGGLKKEIQERKLNLKMAAILVSDDVGLKKFVGLKEGAAKSIGIDFQGYFFDENISEEDLTEEVKSISADPNINGVFIELPLPQHINTQNILNTIPPEKDLDALSQPLQDKFYSGDFYILPPAVESVSMVFKKYSIDPKGKKIAVFGYGFLVGKPVAYWLEKQGAEVSVIRSKTENPAEISKKADVVISGVGKPGLITGDMVKEGVIVIDFGYGPDSSKSKKDLRRIEDPRFSNQALPEENRDKKKGKMVGDVDFNSVSSKASLITPVPGGMGPILIAAVLKNLIKLSLASNLAEWR